MPQIFPLFFLRFPLVKESKQKQTLTKHSDWQRIFKVKSLEFIKMNIYVITFLVTVVEVIFCI